MSGSVKAKSSTIDEKDLKLLRMLARNARASYSELGRAIGVSDVAAMKRLRKLEQLGVIVRYTIDVDPRKLGYSLVSITGIDVEPQHLFDVLKSLKEMNEVKFIAISSGDHAIMTIVWAKSSDDLARIHREISNLPGVKRVCPSVVLDVVKDEKL